AAAEAAGVARGGDGPVGGDVVGGLAVGGDDGPVAGDHRGSGDDGLLGPLDARVGGLGEGAHQAGGVVGAGVGAARGDGHGGARHDGDGGRAGADPAVTAGVGPVEGAGDFHVVVGRGGVAQCGVGQCGVA